MTLGKIGCTHTLANNYDEFATVPCSPEASKQGGLSITEYYPDSPIACKDQSGNNLLENELYLIYFNI